jgi:hypothetical protein
MKLIHFLWDVKDSTLKTKAGLKTKGDVRKMVQGWMELGWLRRETTPTPRQDTQRTS